jgi:hypothetical protein
VDYTKLVGHVCRVVYYIYRFVANATDERNYYDKPFGPRAFVQSITRLHFALLAGSERRRLLPATCQSIPSFTSGCVNSARGLAPAAPRRVATLVAVVVVVVVVVVTVAADRRLRRQPGRAGASSTTTNALDFMAAGSLTPTDLRNALSQPLLSLSHCSLLMPHRSKSVQTLSRRPHLDPIVYARPPPRIFTTGSIPPHRFHSTTQLSSPSLFLVYSALKAETRNDGLGAPSGCSIR